MVAAVRKGGTEPGLQALWYFPCPCRMLLVGQEKRGGMMKRLRLCVAGLMLVAGAPAYAQTPAATTTQQDFDAATKLHDDGNFAGALTAWQALEHRPKVSHRTLALIKLRKSFTLFKLGRLDEAAAEARVGLAALPAGDASLDEDRYLSWFAIAQAAETELDFATAADAYRKAVPLASAPISALAAQRGLVTTETFVDSDAVLAEIAKLDQLLVASHVENRVAAAIRLVQGRALLNRGDYRGARDKAHEAVKLLGGLTESTDLDDVAARSDYSIAALLLGDKDGARQYMAMTGAGRLPKGDFNPGVQMVPPPCGDDLKPEDAAVVQFSISDDGAVFGVTPIYAAGGGGAALDFSRAVADWSWTPEQAKKLPPFFRNRVRVELRCSTAFNAPSVSRHLAGRLKAWLDEKNVERPAIAESDAVALPHLRTLLAATESAKGASSLALVPILYSLAVNRVASDEESTVAARRALAILDAAGAPPLIRLTFAEMLWRSGIDRRAAAHQYRDRAEAALVDPGFSGDAEARTAIRMLIAGAAGRSDRDAARAALQAIADDHALDHSSPFRAAALIRLASLEARAGDVVAARATFDASGLDGKQCSLIDSPPHMLSSGANASSFPLEAARWGFEGWTEVQFDIAANGKVVAPRAVVSYPPFVFSKAGTNMFGAARYEATFRPNGELACGGSSNRVRFIMPQ